MDIIIGDILKKIPPLDTCIVEINELKKDVQRTEEDLKVLEVNEIAKHVVYRGKAKELLETIAFGNARVQKIEVESGMIVITCYKK